MPLLGAQNDINSWYWLKKGRICINLPSKLPYLVNISYTFAPYPPKLVKKLDPKGKKIDIQ